MSFEVPHGVTFSLDMSVSSLRVKSRAALAVRVVRYQTFKGYFHLFYNVKENRHLVFQQLVHTTPQKPKRSNM